MLSLNHVEFFAEDADATGSALAERYRLSVLGRRDDGSSRSVALGIGRVTLVVTDGRPGSRAAEYVRAHGAGVADVALATDDAAAAYETAVSAGADGVSPPAGELQGRTAAITAFGDVRHTFVQAPAGVRGRWLPGFGALPEPGPSPVALDRIDHLAVCLPTGELATVVDRYERTLGFSTVFTERIVVGAQAMASQVVQSPGGDVTFTLIEPDAQAAPGQIDRFLKDHGGPGVQHVALSTADIVRTTGDLVGSGVEFLSTPASYYRHLSERLRLAAHTTAELQRLNILADEDHDGQLFQIFTRSTHPRGTFFFELIERLGARTFGSGNIRALYEAVEADGETEKPVR